MIYRDWRLGKVNGEPTGITHLPTWTSFDIQGDVVRVLRVSEVNGANPEELKTLSEMALAAFRSGKVSWMPRRFCSHPHP